MKIEASTGPQGVKVKADRHPLVRLLCYASRHRLQMILGVLSSIVNKIFDLAPPLLIGMAVDVVVAKENSFLAKFGVEDTLLQLWLLAGITLLIWGFESLFDYIADVLWRNLAQALQHELRLDAYSHLQTLELAYFEDRSSGELMSVLNDDVNQLERFLDSGAHDIIILLTTIVVAGSIFFWFVPGLAWMAILPMPFIAWGSLWFQKRIAPRYAAVRDQAGLMNGRLGNSINGIATIKSFTTEQHELQRLTEFSSLYRERNITAIRLSAAFVPLIRMIIVIGFAAILVYAGQQAVNGDLSVGVYSILVFMTQRLLWPLTTLGTTLDLYQRAMASTSRIFDVLETPPAIVGGGVLVDRKDIRGEVRFEKVSFSYNGRETIFNDLSFLVEAGQSIGIVGSTGSGKSTLVKLLLRLYDPDEGRILLDSHDTKTLSLPSLRRAIALVSQDVFLIDGTVRENITYGSFDASDEEIAAAASIAEISDFIESLPQGYETIVGERGQKLSGGQRQRISIARAVLKDAPILVLDEATSSVDNETEAAIQRAIERLSHQRTMIVIAHRLSTVRNCNEILVFDRGDLAERGSHEELLTRAGIYSTLWHVQSGQALRPNRVSA